MTQNPIIFLDIDGVLNHQLYYMKVKQSGAGRVRNMLDDECMTRLNELCKSTEAKVVISSTWRLGRTADELQKILNDGGFTGEVIGKTEDLRYGEAGDCILRGNEILHWIKNHEDLVGKQVGYWEYKRYVIFDDDSDMLYWQKDNYIHVDPYCGLTPHNVFTAKKILGMPENQRNKYIGEAEL